MIQTAKYFFLSFIVSTGAQWTETPFLQTGIPARIPCTRICR